MNGVGLNQNRQAQVSGFSESNKWGISPSVFLWMSGGIFALAAALYGFLTDGVLRDDGYIFFVYARNLANSGTLAFNPGELSFGVTSIAWTGLLAFGTLLWPDPVVVSKFLGAILGGGGMLIWVKFLNRHHLLSAGWGLLAATIAALLPNIGADRMVEGMETPLIFFLTALLANFLFATRRNSWLIGLLAGLLALTRPEFLLFIVGIMVWMTCQREIKAAIKSTGVALAIFCWWPIWLFTQTGSFLPPTRIGKLSVFLPEHLGITITQFQSAGVLDRLDWMLRSIFEFMISGPSEVVFSALLVCATVVTALTILNLRTHWPLILVPLVGWGLLLLYGFSFPLFQIRYFLWLSPILALVLVAAWLLHPYLRKAKWLLIASMFGCLILQGVVLPKRISSVGIQQLRRDMGITISKSTPPDARIALEPIGEIGMYANRYIVDMGGLTDRRVIPFLSDGYLNSPKILECLELFEADYLVTYDHDGFLGRVVREYPERFELVRFVPEEPIGGIRYRLLRIL